MRYVKLNCELWLPNSMAYNVKYFDVKNAYRANGVEHYTISMFIYELDQCKTHANMILMGFIHWQVRVECDNIIKECQRYAKEKL